MIDIDIVNRSSVVSDDGVSSLVPALQIQISRDIAPVWNFDATLHFVGSSAASTPGHWTYLVLDHSDEDGDLGYHFDENGIPAAKVFAAEDLADGTLLSVTISHELIEAGIDPTVSRFITLGDITYPIEIADPVEGDQDGYDIVVDGRSVRVSNWAMPRYYGLPNPAGDLRFDFRGLLKTGIPALRPDGYSMWAQGGAWHSTMAMLAGGARGPRAHRRHKRFALRAREFLHAT